MKKAKKIIGIKVKLTSGGISNITYLATTIEELQKDTNFIAWNDIDKIELIEDNVELYEVDIKDCSGKLAVLKDIRQDWENNKHDYQLRTKEEIINEFKKNENVCIAVKGIGEIELEDVDKYLQ